jgi:hypothetical protein
MGTPKPPCGAAPSSRFNPRFPRSRLPRSQNTRAFLTEEPLTLKRHVSSSLASIYAWSTSETFRASFSPIQISAAPPFPSRSHCISSTGCSRHRESPLPPECLRGAQEETGSLWHVPSLNLLRGSPDVGSSSLRMLPFLVTRSRALIVENPAPQPRHQDHRARHSISQ